MFKKILIYFWCFRARLFDLMLRYGRIRKIWYLFRKRAKFFHSIDLQRTPRLPRSMVWGRAPGFVKADKVELPKLIWSFWVGGESECVKACMRSWYSNAAGYDVKVLNYENLSAYLPDFPFLDKNTVPVQHISDLVRLMLLERYGGIWVDASVIFKKPISWVEKSLISDQCEALFFWNEYEGEYRNEAKAPILENGFFAALRGSKFIADWRVFYQDVLCNPGRRGLFFDDATWGKYSENFVDRRREYLEYFVCYMAAQKVMMSSDFYRLKLLNAEDDYLFHYYATRRPRNKRQFAEAVLLDSDSSENNTRLIKITGGHRRAIDEHLRYGCYKKHSALGQFVEK